MKKKLSEESVNIEYLKENGIITEDRHMTNQGYSLSACLVADELYEEIHYAYPGSMEMVYQFFYRLYLEKNFSAIVSLINQACATFGLEEPVNLNSLSEQPESLVYFIEELMADWLDCMEQSNEN